MIKKLIPFILLCLLFSASVYAENEGPAPRTQGEATEGRMPEGDRGRMGGGRPGGIPDMQNGERPTPPEGNENNENKPSESLGEPQKNENQALPFEDENGNVPENQPNQNQNSENNSVGGEKEENEEKNPPKAFENENGGEKNDENSENNENERDRFPENFGERRGMQTQNEKKSFFEEYFTPVIAMLLLLGAFVFVRLYKRKSY